MASKIPLDNVCEKKIETLSSQYDGEIEYVDISSIDNNEKIISNTQIINAKEAPSRAKQLVKIGDVLVSTVRPNLNAVAMIKKESNLILVASTGYCVLRCNGKVDNHYIFYFCQSPYFIDNMVRQATGASYPAVSNFIVKSCLFPAHNLKHQREIASILDKLRDLIFLRKQQLAKLDELVKARFVEMFGDSTTNSKELKIVRLSEIAEYFNGLTYRPENVSDVGTIVLRSSNIQGNQLDFADTVRVNCQIKERLFIKENDILMCSRNGSARLVGKVALIKGLNEPMSFGAFMMIIRSQYYPYLMTYFQTDDFRRQIKTGATTTINQVTGRMLDEVELPVPELGDMTAFATFTEKIFRQKLTIQQSLDKLEVLRKSLMQEYFG